MKQVADLEGAELDYWVARALGMAASLVYFDTMPGGQVIGRAPSEAPQGVRQSPLTCVAAFRPRGLADSGRIEGFHPSTRWDHGGPIIERERITTGCFEWDDADDETDAPVHRTQWCAWVGANDNYIDRVVVDAQGSGPTALIAAMRALVAAKFGETVGEDAEPSDAK